MLLLDERLDGMFLLDKENVLLKKFDRFMLVTCLIVFSIMGCSGAGVRWSSHVPSDNIKTAELFVLQPFHAYDKRCAYAVQECSSCIGITCPFSTQIHVLRKKILRCTRHGSVFLSIVA